MRAFAVLSLAAVGFVPTVARAGGWQEAHQTSDDVRIAVGPDGVATVVHHLRYRVVAGRFKSFDLTGIDPRAEVVAETVALPEKGGEIAARVEPNVKSPGAMKITFDDPKGLSRGAYVVDVSYKLDLVATKMLVRDGAMWRLAWTAPPSPEGHDGARVVFELPSAPTEPRIASPEQAATTLVTLRRSPEKDELELVRAHIPRGDAVTWSARVDPKAFPRVTSPDLRPALASTSPAQAPSRAPIVLVACGLAALAGVLALALRTKQSKFAEACAKSSAKSRPLVTVPWGMGPFVYGAVATASLVELLWASPTVGALLVVIAMALAAHRAPRVIARPRGPGRWRAVSDDAVLLVRSRSLPGDLFDLGARDGRLFAAALVLAVAGLSFVLATRVPGAGIAIPLAAATLVPLFVTGTRRQLPPLPSELAARVLRPTRDRLGRFMDLAHVNLTCLARFREGVAEFDEVRLACTPSDRIPGLRAIELALATVAPGANAAVPEILVRFDEASAAAAKIAQMAPGLPIVVGRVPEERVLRLAPRSPTPTFAARLLARIATDLEGRRASDRDDSASSQPWAGAERRIAARPRVAAGAVRAKRSEARAPKSAGLGAPVPA